MSANLWIEVDALRFSCTGMQVIANGHSEPVVQVERQCSRASTSDIPHLMAVLTTNSVGLSTKSDGLSNNSEDVGGGSSLGIAIGSYIN